MEGKPPTGIYKPFCQVGVSSIFAHKQAVPHESPAEDAKVAWFNVVTVWRVTPKYLPLVFLESER